MESMFFKGGMTGPVLWTDEQRAEEEVLEKGDSKTWVLFALYSPLGDRMWPGSREKGKALYAQGYTLTEDPLPTGTRRGRDIIVTPGQYI